MRPNIIPNTNLNIPRKITPNIIAAGLLMALLLLLLACDIVPATREPISVSQSDAPAYTKALVEQAIKYYDANGRDHSIAFYNTDDTVDGDWYVFIIDPDEGIISHAARPERRGLTFDELVDSAGYNYGADFARTTSDGEWVSYMFDNPNTNREQQKHSWVVRHDGLIFGSGWYER